MTDSLGSVPLEKPEKKPRRAKVRKHLLTTALKNEVAEKLDKLAAAGHTVLSITASSEFRGFEIVSYSEE